MNKNQILLAALLTAALKNKNIENIDLIQTDWVAIFEEKPVHEVYTIIVLIYKYKVIKHDFLQSSHLFTYCYIFFSFLNK